jgi:hypothetical protein
LLAGAWAEALGTIDGLIQWAGTQFCFDVAGGVFNSGANLDIWQCENSNPNQQFYMENGMIVWAPTANTGSDLCVTVAGGGTTPGTESFLWQCNTADVNQNFTWDAQGFIRWSAHPTLCIDVTGGVAKPGTNVQLWGCATRADGNQQFKYLESLKGKCPVVVDEALLD